MIIFFGDTGAVLFLGVFASMIQTFRQAGHINYKQKHQPSILLRSRRSFFQTKYFQANFLQLVVLSFLIAS